MRSLKSRMSCGATDSLMLHRVRLMFYIVYFDIKCIIVFHVQQFSKVILQSHILQQKRKL